MYISDIMTTAPEDERGALETKVYQELEKRYHRVEDRLTAVASEKQDRAYRAKQAELLKARLTWSELVMPKQSVPSLGADMMKISTGSVPMFTATLADSATAWM